MTKRCRMPRRKAARQMLTRQAHAAKCDGSPKPLSNGMAAKHAPLDKQQPNAALGTAKKKKSEPRQQAASDKQKNATHSKTCSMGIINAYYDKIRRAQQNMLRTGIIQPAAHLLPAQNIDTIIMKRRSLLRSTYRNKKKPRIHAHTPQSNIKIRKFSTIKARMPQPESKTPKMFRIYARMPR